MKQRLFIAVLIAAPLLWLFGRALVSDEMFVFRDAAHYYYPYYKYVAQQWGEGRVPLWNSLENLGQPLLADATAAVLYPGKLIFASPLSYDTNYKLYIVGHVLFAAITAFVAARGFARSAYAATVCAISYAFSGSVVFQYCNVIFLVGAAWLPLAVLATDRMLRKRSWYWAAALAAVLAMMVFGGDPQLAYHVGVIAALYALMLWRVRRNSYPPTDRSDRKSDLRKLAHHFVLLAIAGGFAFILAAAQILPSMQWTPKTSRAATDVPRNIYELSRGVGDEVDLSTSQRLGFLAGNQENDHHIDSYEFSVGPWHLAGCLWPNVFGNLFPENTRWIRALPAEGRMWTPTLYMGLLPLLLALSQFRWRWFSTGRARLPPSQNENVAAHQARQEPRPPNDVDSSRRSWLTWLVILSLLASFGWYGLGWIVIEIYHALAGADAAELPIGSPLGGIYWLLQSFLPGYVLFRYPAKWLVITAMGMSLLSAYGWDGMVDASRCQTRRFVRCALLAVLGLSMIAAVTAKALVFDSTIWEHWCRQVQDDALFGPIDVRSASWNVNIALIHAVILSAFLLWLIPKPRRCADDSVCLRIRSVRLLLLMLLLIVDFCGAQQNLAAIGPVSIWRSPPGAASFINDELNKTHRLRIHPLPPAPLPVAREAESFDPSNLRDRDVPVRVYRQPHSEWVPYLSHDPLIRAAYLDHATLFPKYHLLHGYELLESSPSLSSQDHRAFMREVRRRGARRDDKAIPDIALLELVGTEFVIEHGGRWPEHRKHIDARDWAWGFGIVVLTPDSRARVVYDASTLPELETHSPAAVLQRTNEVVNAIKRDRSGIAVVEMDRQLSASEPTPSGHPCEITAYTPQQVEVRAKLSKVGLVVLTDAFADGWTCEVTNRATGETTTEPILRTNRVMRGVWLPAGEYEIAFRYRPKSFYFGAAISVVGWIALIAVAFLSLRSRKRRLSR